MKRRAFVAGAASSLAGLGAARPRSPSGSASADLTGAAVADDPGSGRDRSLKPGYAPGRLHQSVCRWPFSDIPLEDFCRESRALGLEAIDLLFPDEWALAHSNGLAVSMGYASRRPRLIPDGLNDHGMHATLISELQEAIPSAAEARVRNLIVMSGNRRGRTESQGIAACADGLRQIVPTAERHGVTLCLEMLNSTVDHADYDADSTRYGLEVVQRVGSPSFRLLYDIYHMQVMEGNVIATIRAHRDAIVHLHTAGVPGRHELDDSQELNYRGIARALAELEFEGYIAHEFIPTREPIGALRDAVGVCRV